MHYWRDSEGKGLIGCLFFLLLGAIAMVAAIKVGPAYYSNSNFQNDIQAEASRAGAHFLDDQTITKDVLDMARRNEIDITKDNLTIERFAGQVHITVEYVVPVDFIIFQRDFDFQIKSSSFIGRL